MNPSDPNSPAVDPIPAARRTRLLIACKPGEGIMLGPDRTIVTLHVTKKGQIRLCVEALSHIQITRIETEHNSH